MFCDIIFAENNVDLKKVETTVQDVFLLGTLSSPLDSNLSFQLIHSNFADFCTCAGLCLVARKMSLEFCSNCAGMAHFMGKLKIL